MCQNQLKLMASGFDSNILNDLVTEIAKRVASSIDTMQPAVKSEQLLTCKEVEALLDISPPTRIAWTRNGALKAYALGSRKYYKRSDIENGMLPIEQIKSFPITKKS